MKNFTIIIVIFLIGLVALIIFFMTSVSPDIESKGPSETIALIALITAIVSFLTSIVGLINKIIDLRHNQKK